MVFVSYSTKINGPVENIWETLRSFDNVESYMPIVTRTTLEGFGQGSKRTCDVSMGTQMFKIQETLKKLDDSNHLLTLSVDEGPIQMRGLNISFRVIPCEGGSEVTITTSVENPMAAAFSENIFAMIGIGLKKLHEL